MIRSLAKAFRWHGAMLHASLSRWPVTESVARPIYPLHCESLEARRMLASTAAISEFMAINDGQLEDQDGGSPDWIEIYNPADTDLSLGGWHLTDDPEDLTKWQLPDVTVPADGYLVVFASGKDRTGAGGELHTNFKLSGGGEYLALVQADGQTIAFAYDTVLPGGVVGFPEQFPNLSFGYNLGPLPTRLPGLDTVVGAIELDVDLTQDATHRFLVPTSMEQWNPNWTQSDFGDPSGVWTTSGAGNRFGFDTGQSEGIDDSLLGYWPLDEMDGNTAADASGRGFDANVSGGLFSSQGGRNGGGLFFDGANTLVVLGGDAGALNPSQALTFSTWVKLASDQDALKVLVSKGGLTGMLFILAVDNQRLTLSFSETGGAATQTIRDSRQLTAADGWVHVAFTITADSGTAPGEIKLYKQGNLVGTAQHNATSLPSVDQPVMLGNTPDRFSFLTLLGLLDDVGIWSEALSQDQILDLAGGTTPLESSSPSDEDYTELIGTDLESAMFEQNASVLVRTVFDIADPLLIDDLKLSTRYDDGFVAYLNGTEVARGNAPDSLQWNSTASGRREDDVAIQLEEIALPGAEQLLRPGTNVLAVQGLNVAADNPDFLLQTHLLARVVRPVDPSLARYFAPTPGQPNTSSSFLGAVRDTQFSHDRGLYDATFDLTISTETEGATIRYTTDGSEPSETTGAVYTGSIPIRGTTVVRAAAFKPGFAPTNVDTQTYLFLDDVVTQSADGQPPPGWPRRWGSNRVDYGMDPDIAGDPVWGSQLKDALEALPTISFVTDLDNLFDRRTGIYANPGRRGREWERPTSVELINPDGSEGFQVDAGLRIRGGSSRRTSNAKHSLRLFFRGEFGDTKLRYPLFGDEGAEEYDHIDLRTSSDFSWENGSTRFAFLRDVFSRDSERDVGQPYTRVSYNHVYINGLYWGIYQLQEKPKASYGESYLGGKKKDYDAIKIHRGNEQETFTIENSDGNFDAYQRFWEATIAGYDSAEAYWKVQGRNPDGTRNPDYEVLLDVENLIDHMLVIFYTGNRDEPLSGFLGNQLPNNTWALYNRNGGDGWKFFTHDNENSLDDGERDRTGPFGQASLELKHFNPQVVHQALLVNPAYRLRFADRAQRHMFHGGALTDEASLERLMARAEELDLAIIGESARWGDSSRSRPFTKEDWLRAVDVVKAWFTSGRDGSRRDTVLTQLIRDDLYPDMEAPTFNKRGGVVSRALPISLSAPEGTIYYTTDGSDPRLIGGGVSANATAYAEPLSISDDVTVKARVLSQGEWSALEEVDFLLASDLSLRITEINYNPYDANLVAGLGETDSDNDRFEFVELTNVGAEAIDLGGVQLVEQNVGEGQEGIAFRFAPQMLESGERIVVVRDVEAFGSRYAAMVRVAQGNDSEGGTPGEYGGRLSNNGEHITLVDADGKIIQQFEYGTDANWPGRASGKGSSLEVIDSSGDYSDPRNWRGSTEFGGSPGSPGLAGGNRIAINELLANTEPPQVDLVELRNLTGHDINIAGWYLSDSDDNYFKFHVDTSTIIPALGYHVLSATELGFDLSGNRSGDGSGDVWLVAVDSGGRPSVFVDHVQFGASAGGVSMGPWPTRNDAWISLAQPTFGGPNSGPRVGEVVISEVHYGPLDPDGEGRLRADDFEFIELYNHTNMPIDISNWQLAGTVTFEFPSGTIIDAGETLTVVGFDTTRGTSANVFRFTLQMSASAQLVGPYAGPLDDARGLIQLLRPATALHDQPGFVSKVLVDEVRFDSDVPWPSSPAGLDDSLTRTQPGDYGNFPTSWIARSPSPGVVDFLMRQPGDANDDGQFDQRDIDLALAGGKYMTGQRASWQEGDWTGDGKFDQLDIVAALQRGNYQPN